MLTLLLAACVHGNHYHGNRSGIIEKALRQQRGLSNPVNSVVELPGLGVSIDFTSLEGWGRGLTPKAFTFGKAQNEENFHSTLLTIEPVFPPQGSFTNNDDFYKAAAESIEATRGKFGKELVLDIAPDSDKAQRCIAFHRKIETNDDALGPKVPLFYNSFQYLCEHPARPGVFVSINYSERYRATMPNDNFLVNAKRMLSHVTFIGYGA